jgi:acetyltransferase-like isoleucine patch superfamily enzyme
MKRYAGAILRAARALARRAGAAVCLRVSEWFAVHGLDGLIPWRLALLRLAGIRVRGPTFIDRGFRCLYPQNLVIGRHVSMGHDNHLWCFTPVRIGSYTITAKDLRIVSASHDVSTFEPLPGQEVEIGPGCWIGARVTILGGARIGRGCVVGAGSVVRGNLPDWSVAAGVPARVIRLREPAAQIWNPFGSYTQETLADSEP